MSERKVLNKYYPPDFDPSKIPRLRLPKNRQYTVRIMAPCNMRCNTCGDYIARGKKFNARKETVESEDYLGLKVFRFYFKCPVCMQEITFKTDPKNYDYIVEHGATPNFKALKLAQQQAIEEQKEIDEEERLNPMKLLENRTKASRREMENLESLEDLKELSQREVVIDYEELLRKKKEEFEAELKRQEEEDEAFVESIFGNKNKNKESKNTKWKSMGTLAEQDEDYDDDDEEDEEEEEGFDETDIKKIKNTENKIDEEDGDEIIEEFDFKYPSIPKNRQIDESNGNTSEIISTSSSSSFSSTSTCTDILNNPNPSSSSENPNSSQKRKLKSKLSNLVVIKRNKNDSVSGDSSSTSTSSSTTNSSKPTSSSSVLSSLCSYSDSDNSD